jgi:hypothetical protein
VGTSAYGRVNPVELLELEVDPTFADLRVRGVLCLLVPTANRPPRQEGGGDRRHDSHHVEDVVPVFAPPTCHDQARSRAAFRSTGAEPSDPAVVGRGYRVRAW